MATLVCASARTVAVRILGTNTFLADGAWGHNGSGGSTSSDNSRGRGMKADTGGRAIGPSPRRAGR